MQEQKIGYQVNKTGILVNLSLKTSIILPKNNGSSKFKKIHKDKEYIYIYIVCFKKKEGDFDQKRKKKKEGVTPLQALASIPFTFKPSTCLTWWHKSCLN